MGNLIESYDLDLVEPGCAPGAGRYGILVILPNDISIVFPYLNAVFPNAQYDHANEVLILKKPTQWYAFRPREIRIANLEGLEGLSQAREIAENLVGRINKIWEQRKDIVPRLTERKLASIMDIYQLLPRTNCRQCGYLTCLAFAADLRKAATRLEACLPLLKPENTVTKDKIHDLMADE